MRLNLGILFLFVLAFGCVHETPVGPSTQEISAYEFLMQAEESGDAVKTEEKAKEFLLKFPASKWRSNSLLSLGLALKNQGKILEAEGILKQVVELHQGQASPNSTLALYHLALIYDTLGDDDRQMLTLLQAGDGLKFLPVEIAQAEWPARLAAAYARRGQSDQAKEYAVKAEAGLKKLIGMDKPGPEKWLPKVYLSMGHISTAALEFKSQSDLEKFFDLFSYSQTWLVLAAETGADPWAPRGADELIVTYDKMWSFIEHLPPNAQPNGNNDPLLVIKDQQQRQKALAFKLDQLLRDLKSQRVSLQPQKPELMERLFSKIEDLQKRVDVLIGAKDVQDKNLKATPTEKPVKKNTQKLRKH